MKILYLTYGQQSGVIEYLFKEFRKKKGEITVFNTAENLTYSMKKSTVSFATTS